MGKLSFPVTLLASLALAIPAVARDPAAPSASQHAPRPPSRQRPAFSEASIPPLLRVMRAQSQPTAKVSSLVSATTPFTGAELLYVVQGGASKKTTFSTLAAQIGSSVAPPSAAAFNMEVAGSIASGQEGLSLVPGTYYFARTTANLPFGTAAAALVNGAGNFTIDGQGSTIVMTGTDVGSYASLFFFENATPGTTLTIADLTVQYQTPPFAQAAMSASPSACVGNANGSATFAMNAGFTPSFAAVERIDQRNPAPDSKTGVPGLFVANVYETQTAGNAIPMSLVSPGVYSLAFNGAAQCAALASMTPGDSYTLEPTQFAFGAFLFYQMANITLDNVTVLEAAGNGFTFVGAGNVAVKNGTGVVPALGNWLSSNGGGFAFIAAGGIVTVDSSVRGISTGDDALFIAPYMDAISNVSGNAVVSPSIAAPIADGDIFQFVSSAGALLGTSALTGISSGNTLIFGGGLPGGVSTSSVMVDLNQAPLQCSISGTYGNTPTRGIWADCLYTTFNAPLIQNTGAGAIYVTWNDQGGIGIIPSAVVLNGPVGINANYASDAFDAMFEVAGWNVARWTAAGAAATAGQVGLEIFNSVNCQYSGSSCVYAGQGAKVAVSFGSLESWYGLGAGPGFNSQGCGASMYQYAVAFCGSTAVYGPGYFLSGGLQETSSNSTITYPPFPLGALVGLGTGIPCSVSGVPTIYDGTGAIKISSGVCGQAATTDLSDSGAWTTYVMTPTCATGSGTWGVVSGRFKTILGKTTFISISATLTTAGSCAQPLLFTLPNTSVNAGGVQSVFGGEDQNTQDTIRGKISPNSAGMQVTGVGVTLPVANGAVYDLNGTYENQ